MCSCPRGVSVISHRFHRLSINGSMAEVADGVPGIMQLMNKSWQWQLMVALPTEPVCPSCMQS